MHFISLPLASVFFKIPANNSPGLPQWLRKCSKIELAACKGLINVSCYFGGVAIVVPCSMDPLFFLLYGIVCGALSNLRLTQLLSLMCMILVLMPDRLELYSWSLRVLLIDSSNRCFSSVKWKQ